jgi:hypothetical protein
MDGAVSDNADDVKYVSDISPKRNLTLSNMMDSVPEDSPLDQKQYSRCSVVPIENFPIVENTPNETREDRPPCHFLKRNRLSLCISVLVCGIAGVLKYLGNTVWFVDEKWTLVETQVCNGLDNQIICDLTNINCRNAYDNSSSPNFSLNIPVGCFNGTNCLTFNQAQCLYTADYVPPSRANFRLSALTTIAFTIIGRFWIERVFPNQWKNYILILPVGWMMEAFFLLRGVTSFEGSIIGTTYSGPVTNISVALATNVVVHKLFLALRSKTRRRTEVENSTFRRSSIMQRSLGEGRVQKIKGLSCKELVKMHVHPIYIGQILISGVVLGLGLGVSGELFFLARDGGLIFMFAAIGLIVGRVFHDLWLQEENKLEHEPRQNRFSSASISSSVSCAADGRISISSPSSISKQLPLPSRKLKAFRLTSSFISIGGSVVPGFLFSIDSPIPLPFAAFIIGILFSRTLRNFKHIITHWRPTSQTRCKRIIYIFGRIIGLGGLISLFSTWQAYDSSLSRDISPNNLENHALSNHFLEGFQPTTAALVAAPLFSLGWLVFKKLESNRKSRLLNFLGFTAYYPVLLSSGAVYGVSRFHHLGKNNKSLAIYKAAGYGLFGATIFLHRSAAASNFFSEEILMNPLSPLFASGALSWYMGVQPFDAFLGPPITSRVTI